MLLLLLVSYPAVARAIGYLYTVGIKLERYYSVYSSLREPISNLLSTVDSKRVSTKNSPCAAGIGVSQGDSLVLRVLGQKFIFRRQQGKLQVLGAYRVTLRY